MLDEMLLAGELQEPSKKVSLYCALTSHGPDLNTLVIASPAGNLKKYLQSLTRNVHELKHVA